MSSAPSNEDKAWAEVGDALVVLRLWSWMAGMLTLPDRFGRTFRLMSKGRSVQEGGEVLRCVGTWHALSPDLRDRATRAVARELVIDAGGYSRLEDTYADDALMESRRILAVLEALS